MVKEIRTYIEGGGDSKSTWQSVREGFGKFLEPLRDLARSRRIRWSIVTGGSGSETFKEFRMALRSYPEAFSVLLVDSEARVILPRVEHLRQSGWDVSSLSEDQCHFMVQAVEAWLLADPDALASYYGQGFRRNALPGQEDVETISKEQLAPSLNRATANTRKGSYHKIHHCADLLARLDRARVRQHARHCDLLFTFLESLIRQP